MICWSSLLCSGLKLISVCIIDYLQTGEIYYINWRNGMKAKEDPRRAADEYNNVSKDYESGEEEEEESWYDSEESSSESSSKGHYVEKQNVLVVAGCKSCLMYFMVPKQVEDCPKCSGQLLHFDRSQNGSLWLPLPFPLVALAFGLHCFCLIVSSFCLLN